MKRMQNRRQTPKRPAAGERQDESQTSVRTNARSETAAKTNARSETAAETKSAWRQAAALGHRAGGVRQGEHSSSPAATDLPFSKMLSWDERPKNHVFEKRRKRQEELETDGPVGFQLSPVALALSRQIYVFMYMSVYI